MEHEKKENQLICFVIMPFGSKGEYKDGNLESNYVYVDIICRALNEYSEKVNKNIKIIREFDKNEPGSISKSIVENIGKSDICIVDITGHNPNVFFELGIRYCLRSKVTILLRQEKTEIPFDITNYRCITYNIYKPKQAICEIIDYLQSGISSRNSDSLIYEVFPDMSLIIPNIITSGNILEQNKISWDEWWNQITFNIDLLKKPYDGGHFSPDVIFGLSNCGTLVAELIGKGLLLTKPILMLWLDRWSQKDPTKFCENKINLGLLNGLKEFYNKKSLNILVVDDIVDTGTSFFSASSFIIKTLDEIKCNILFIPLFAKNESYLEKFEECLIIGKSNINLFRIKKEDYYEKLLTSKQKFPYDKHI
jgi:hypoxanthine phosphoribosyltransferase